MNKDLTEGKPDQVLWRFCLPLFGSVIFQQLYNIADSLIAGRFLGENALAAVGNSYEITLIYIAFAFGINIGCSVVVSRLFGAKRFGEMKTAVSTTFAAGGILCLLLMLFGFLATPALLRLINTPSELFDDSLLYLYIYTGGLLFMFFYNIATGIFSAMGDSRTPFIFLAASSVSNVAVDILFVNNLNMGVDGVAWATFLCQGISCVLALVTIIRRLGKIKAGKHVWFSFAALRDVTVIAVPSILQQSFISVGNIVIQGVINSFGPAVMAGYSASVKLNNLVITSFTTLGNGMSNFTAQNMGAGKTERIKSGHAAGLKMMYLLCVPIILIYMLCSRYMVMWFMTEGSKEAVDAGVLFLRVVAPFYWVVGTKLITDGVLRGAGAMKVFMAATFTDLVLRVALVLILSGPLGIMGVWSSWPIGWTLGTCLSLFFYFKGYWKKKTA